MPVRKNLKIEDIVVAAKGIVERNGHEALSMRNLALLLGVKAPSLYEYVRNRDEIIALVQAAGLEQFGREFSSTGDTVREKVMFYRNWARSNPNLYPVIFQRFLFRDLLPAGLEESVLWQVIEAVGGSHLQARLVWAQLHGLVDLELHDRLPKDADLEATWEQVILGIEAARESYLEG